MPPSKRKKSFEGKGNIIIERFIGGGVNCVYRFVLKFSVRSKVSELLQQPCVMMTGLPQNSDSIFSKRKRCGSLFRFRGFSCRTDGGRCCKVRRRWVEHQCRDWGNARAMRCWVGRKQLLPLVPVAQRPLLQRERSGCPRTRTVGTDYRWRDGGIFRVFPLLAASVYC